MVMIAKRPVGVLLILFSVLLLGACSSTPDVLTTPLPVEDAQAQPPTETSTAEILIAPSSSPTETSPWPWCSSPVGPRPRSPWAPASLGSGSSWSTRRKTTPRAECKKTFSSSLKALVHYSRFDRSKYPAYREKIECGRFHFHHKNPERSHALPYS